MTKKIPKPKPPRQSTLVTFWAPQQVLRHLDEIVAARRRVKGRGNRTEVLCDLVLEAKEGQTAAAD